MNSTNKLIILSTSLAWATVACGDEAMELGSRYLKSQTIVASAGGGFEVTDADSTAFSGVAIQVPPGALPEDTTITVAPSADLTASDDVEWVGPAMEFGPAGLVFSTPATVTLRVDSGLGENEPAVRVVSADGTSEWIDAALIDINTDGTWSFPVNHFTRFQPGRRQVVVRGGPTCRTDADCGAGESCVFGGVCAEVTVDNGTPNIREVAEAAGIFGTLLQTVDRLDIAGILSLPAELTAFAPTDAAFAALPVNLSQVHDDIVQNIILAHLAGDDFDAAALTAAGEVTSIAKITHPFANGRVRNASVATTDVRASNGIIHILGDVIVPPTTLENLVELRFSALASAVASASPATQSAIDPDTLGGAAPITVFAPTNGAFAEANLAGEDLDAVLGAHVVAGQITSADLTPGRVITTITGSRLTVGTDGRPASLTDERGNTISVLFNDIRTLSGVVHIIDGVLLPARRP